MNFSLYQRWLLSLRQNAATTPKGNALPKARGGEAAQKEPTSSTAQLL